MKTPFASFFYKYDDQGRLITTMDYLGIKTFYEYNASSISPKSSINQFEYIKYDVNGNPVHLFSVNGLKAIWKWKDKDHIESFSTPGAGTIFMGMRKTMTSTWKQANSPTSPLFSKNARNYSSLIHKGMKTIGYSATKIKPFNNPPPLNSLISIGKQFKTTLAKLQLSEPVQKYQGSLASISLAALPKSSWSGLGRLGTPLGIITGYMRIYSKYSPQQRRPTNPEFLEENLLHASQSFFGGAMGGFGVAGAIGSAAYNMGSNALVNITREPASSFFYNLITYPEWKRYQMSEFKFGRTPMTLSQYRKGGITTQENVSTRKYNLPHLPPLSPRGVGGSLPPSALGGINLTTTLEYSLDKDGIIKEMDAAIAKKISSTDDESSEIEIDGEKYQFAKIPIKNKTAHEKPSLKKQTSTFLHTGNFVYNEMDFCVEKVDDVCIGFYRFYNSFRVSKSKFGYGWTSFPYAIKTYESKSEILLYDNINGKKLKYTVSDFQVEGQSQEDITFYECNEETAPILGMANNKNYIVIDQTGTQFTFEPDGKMISQEAGGITLSYMYNKNRLSAIKSSKGRLIKFGYDRNGRIIQVRVEGKIGSHYTYDPSGDLFSRTSLDGEMVAYYYNDNHFLSQIVIDSDKDDDEPALKYDKNGRIITIEKNGTKTVIKYNDEHRIVNVVGADNKEIEYQFQDEDKIASITWPDKRVKIFSYGLDGKLFQLADGSFEFDNNVKKIKFDQIITY